MNIFELPSKIGSSGLSISIIRLSISKPFKAASKCSVVCTIASFFLSCVLLFVWSRLAILASIIGLFSKSILINLMPVFIGAALKVRVDFFPV